MLGQFKKYALRAFANAGFDRACISFHSRDALVLVYHGIFDEEKPEPFRYHHTAAEFEAHLDWLGTRCTPVALADFARWKRGEWRPRKPPVLVTFDDGYRNNAVLAAPMLKRKGIPALFFLASGYIDERTGSVARRSLRSRLRVDRAGARWPRRSDPRDSAKPAAA